MVGAGIRWATVRWLGENATEVALLGVNLAGCLALGVLSGFPAGVLHARTMALLGAGVCGSLTTWSSLAVQVAADLRIGDWAQGLAWLAANLALGVAAAASGRLLGRSATTTSTGSVR